MVCSKYLLGEGLQSLLQKENDLQLIGPWELKDNFLHLVPQYELDVVLVADEDPNSEGVVSLTNKIMQRYPDLPVIRVGLTQNIFYIVETHAFPARGTDLIETIRGLPSKKS